MNRLVYILVFTCCFFGARAQKENDLLLRARVVEDQIYLRWSSSNLEWIEAGQENGFLLTKKSLDDKENALEVHRLKMESPSVWKLGEDSRVEIVQKAYDALYAAHDELNIVDKIQLKRSTYSIILYMADLSPEVARLTTTGFIDSKINKNKTYRYTLSIPSLPEIQPVFIDINSNEVYNTPVVSNILPKGKDLKASLIWDYSSLKEIYSSYVIEKSVDGGRTYQPTSSAPFLPIINYDQEKELYIANFEDELDENGMSYFYRIAGIDFFGQVGPFSQPIEVVGIPDPIPIQASFDRIIHQDDDSFDISWYLQSKWESKIKGFYILRSTDGKQTFQKISSLLGPTQRQFKDQSPTNISFYKVVTLDENNHELESPAGLAQKKDNVPPDAPVWKSGYIDTTGAVFLFWEENIEEDLGGYHVFYANSEHAEYSKLTNSAELETTEFVDSIEVKTLTKDIYYKLMAIDFKGNQSAYSEALKLTRPDVIPPRPSVFKKCTQEIDQNKLRFTSSSSADLRHTDLERKSPLSTWEVIYKTEERGETIQFIDSTGICTELYSYRLRSEDESGLYSMSDTIQLRCIDSGKRPTISDFEVAFEGEKVVLQWDYTFYDQVKSLLIYRQEDGGKLRKLKQLWKDDITASNRRSYIDDDIQEGKKYAYQIIIRFDDNGFAKSAKSNFITIPKE